MLVLDDDRAMVETLLAMLEDHHDVFGTTDPKAALDQLGKREYQVAIADWNMPVMDGVEFFRRANQLGRPLACLLITGRIEDYGAEVPHHDRKMLGLLAKPFSEAQLLERIKQMGRLAAMKQSVIRMRGST